jgi:hypothetical protein
MPWGGLAMIIDAHPEFPATTIYTWHRKWCEDPDWRPDTTDRSHNRRKLTDEQEAEIEAEIMAQYFGKHRRLSCRQFKGLTIAYWQRQKIENTKSPTFAGSSRFRVGFFKRHHLSLRSATLKKKEPVHNEAVIAQYLARVRTALEKYGP